MSELLAGAISSWGLALANASVAAVLVVPVAWAIESLWKSMPSSWRSWMWRLVFVKVIGAAVVPYAIELPILPAAEVVHASSIGSTARADETQGHFARTQSVVTQHEASPTHWWQFSRALPALFALWVLGIAANVGFALLRRSRVEKSRRGTTRVIDDPAVSALDGLYQRFGLRKRPDLIATPHEGSPFVADWIRPALYCPANWLSTCSANEMRLAFAHELAHLARGDLNWNRFVAACQAILFFHPAVWLAVWRYRTAQEIACDEMALARTGGSPCDLARLLVGFVEQDSARFYGAAAMTGASVTIRERVLAMQRTIGSKTPGLWTTALAVIVAIAVLTPWTLGQEKPKIKRKKKTQTTEQPSPQQDEGSSASASASATTGGSASGSVSGGGSASITVTGPGAANVQQGNGQQSTGTSNKIDVSESSSTSTTNGKTTTTSKRTISVLDDDREIKIIETNDEVRVSIIDRKSGEEKTYVAKNAKELRNKYVEAYEAYKNNASRVKAGKTGATTLKSDKLLKLRKGPKPSATNKLLEGRMEAMLNDPEIKGTPMEKMILQMRKRMEKKEAAKAKEAGADDEDDEDGDEEASEAEEANDGEANEESEDIEEAEEAAPSAGINERIEAVVP